ncbi:hypothetical protein [Streptomyces achromogenes]|uniref:hypothetical protein n=1 Tax=Streptomyces achromogenes TaxID=67255 RepID=UPI0036C52D2F
MIGNARRLHPRCRFSVASATDLDLDEACLIERAGLRPVAELRLPAEEYSGPGVVVMAERPG